MRVFAGAALDGQNVETTVSVSRSHQRDAHTSIADTLACVHQLHTVPQLHAFPRNWIPVSNTSFMIIILRLSVLIGFRLGHTTCFPVPVHFGTGEVWNAPWTLGRTSSLNEAKRGSDRAALSGVSGHALASTRPTTRNVV